MVRFAVFTLASENSHTRLGCPRHSLGIPVVFTNCFEIHDGILVLRLPLCPPSAKPAVPQMPHMFVDLTFSRTLNGPDNPNGNSARMIQNQPSILDGQQIPVCRPAARFNIARVPTAVFRHVNFFTRSKPPPIRRRSRPRIISYRISSEPGGAEFQNSSQSMEAQFLSSGVGVEGKVSPSATFL